jgi:hypothetical protein
MTKIPRKLSLVRFDATAIPKPYRRKYPLQSGRTYVFFGEIPNMRGHCIVADHRTGQIYFGYHTENFCELTEQEARIRK